MTHVGRDSAPDAGRYQDTTSHDAPRDTPATREHSGRPTSWVAVTVIIVGFTIGGLGLVLGPTWWLFWAGVGVTVVGGIFGLATGIMDDYTTESH